MKHQQQQPQRQPQQLKISFRGRVTGPAAALIDSAAATRPTQAGISGDLLSTATAAVTAPARPNIGQMTDTQ